MSELNVISPAVLDANFNFMRFLTFLKENNIIAIAIASVLSARINEITSSFVSYLIMPIINRNSQDSNDISKLEEKTYDVLGIRFRIGEFAVKLIEFVLITYVIFIFASMLKKYMK